MNAVFEVGGVIPSAPGGLIFTNGALTFNFYIAPNGDDNNPGTLGSPWSITALNSKQSTYSGKKIGVIGDISGTQTPITYGTIAGIQTTLQSLVNSSVVALNVNGGTSTSRTVIASCDSTGTYQRGWAIIDAQHPTTDGDNLMGWSKYGTLPPRSDYVTYDGLTIRNFNYSGIIIGGSGTQANCTIQNCEFYGVTNASTSNNPGCIRLDTTTNAQILNCKFHDCASTSGGFPPAYSAVFSYASTGVTVTNCTMYNLDASVQQKDSNQDAVVSYCYMDFGSFGATSGGTYGAYYEGVVGSGRSTVLHHNIILGPFNIQGGSPANFSGNYTLYNNTFCVASLSADPIFYWFQPNAGGTVNVYNNVITQQGNSWTGGGEYGVAKATGANGTTIPQWDYNYYTSSPQFCPSGTPASLVSYATWQGLGFDAHSHTGGSPYASTPTSSSGVPNISSFTLSNSSPAYTGGIGGAICGALDGSGTVGCNF